jgi:hypothetical protein
MLYSAVQAGQAILVNVVAVSTGKARSVRSSATKRTGTATKQPSIIQTARRLGQLIPARERKRIPKDLSDQVDGSLTNDRHFAQEVFTLLLKNR